MSNNNAKKVKINGNPQILSSAYEEMRNEVVELELRARYWKAQYEVRYYTLEAEKIQTPYNEYLDAERAKRDEMLKALKENVSTIEDNVDKGTLKVE